MSEASEIFAKRLKQLREKEGLGVRELSEKMGISHSSISQYENNKNMPTVTACKAFAQFFNVSLDYILGYDVEIEKDLNFIIDTKMELAKDLDDLTNKLEEAQNKIKEIKKKI